MKKLIKILPLILIASLFFSNCKKYPEGPVISMRTKIARITGVWEPTVFLVNQQDSLFYLKADSCFDNYLFITNGFSHRYEVHTGGSNGSNCTRQGSWQLKNNKKTLSVKFIKSFTNNTIFGPYGSVEKEIDWEIIRLTNKQMKLKTEYLGNLYEVTFTKVADKK